MAKLAGHPLSGSPYNKLIYDRCDSNGVPLFRVTDVDAPASGAFEALGRAFARHGGRCFYCPTKFKPQSFSNNAAHRDHVHAKSAGGSDMLHNLVIACAKCGRTKGSDSIYDFRPTSAKEYLAALESHIARCVKDADRDKTSPPSPPRPSPGAAAGP